MNIIKRLIKYCILKIRLRNKVVFSFSVNIALSSKFEGMNKLHEHSSFCGKMGFGSYLGPNSYVVGNIGRFTSIDVIREFIHINYLMLQLHLRFIL